MLIILFLVFILSLTTVSASDLEANDNSLKIESHNDNSIRNEDNSIVRNEANTKVKTNPNHKVSNLEGDVATRQNISVYSTKKSDNKKTHIELDNDADKENVKIGEFVTWTFEAKNYGPNLATNTKVHITLAKGLKFIKYDASKGTFDPKTGIWTIGDLEAGEKLVLKIVSQAITAGEKVTIANLTSDTNSTTPKECNEEEEIDVEKEEIDVEEHTAKEKKISKELYQTGTPIGLLVLSLLVIFATGIKRIF